MWGVVTSAVESQVEVSFELFPIFVAAEATLTGLAGRDRIPDLSLDVCYPQIKPCVFANHDEVVLSVPCSSLAHHQTLFPGY